MVGMQPTFPQAFVSLPLCFQVCVFGHVVWVLSELGPSVQTSHEVYLQEQKALIPLLLQLLRGSLTVVQGEEGRMRFHVITKLNSICVLL